MWLITTFPSLKYDIDIYPAIKKHLLTFGKGRLMQSGENGARKKTNNKWFEIQDSIGYWEDFYKQKIVWKAIGKNLAFSILEEGKFLTAPASFITSKYNYFLLGLLCSSFAKYYIYKNSDTTGAGDIMLNIQSLESIPFPKISIENQLPVVQIVEKIISSLRENISICELEIELNNLVNSLYGFNNKEINFINSH
jgi:adenine-specific DNA-methyltransferase